MYFLIEDDDLLEEYYTIYNKVSTDIKKIDSNPAYKKNFLKTKIKSHADKKIFMKKKFLRWIPITLV